MNLSKTVLVPMKVFIDDEGFCFIVNGLNKVLEYEWGFKISASFKETKKYKFEIQVPIQIVGQFLENNMTSLDLYTLQKMNTSE